MDSPLLRTEIQDFISNAMPLNFSKVALMKNPFPDVKWNDILNQIASKGKAKEKLPSWYAHKCILYPSKISIEQTSSEKTAAYKASLISGVTLIDLTGGFGVDDYFFAQKFNKVAHCEINEELSAIASHNFHILNQKNIECYQGDGTEILKQLQIKWNWIYIDPSRRSDVKGKVFLLKDCLPNVTNLLDFYFEYSNNILIKTAPILDISAGLSELKFVKTVHIIALDNEVKELLWEIEKDFNGELEIKAVALSKDKTDIFTVKQTDFDTKSNYELPKKILYEPNAAMMKTGAFEAIGAIYNIGKLHQHSHLFTSDEIVEFPGRRFIIKDYFPYDKSEMKILQEEKLNITTRNFPISVEEIRKRWKIKDGGNNYCFFTTDLNNDKIVLLCEKI